MLILPTPLVGEGEVERSETGEGCYRANIGWVRRSASAARSSVSAC